jgi:hypothetical protein
VGAASREPEGRAGRRRLLAWTSGAALAGLLGGRRAAGAQAAAVPPITGSWRGVILHDQPGSASLDVLATFTADGNYVQHPQPGQSMAHGAWQRTGERTYDLTLEQLAFDQEGGTLDYRLRARAALDLDAGGNVLNARFRFEIQTPDGRVRDMGTGTGQGTRITVEPL